jgi:hypothetical protein
MSLGDSSRLVTEAALIRLDDYGASVHCVGSSVPANAGMPLLSRSYSGGQTIQLDIPPGHATLVLTTYADTLGQSVLGQGCAEADLTPGAQVCFDLTIAAPLDLSISSPDAHPGTDMGNGMTLDLSADMGGITGFDLSGAADFGCQIVPHDNGVGGFYYDCDPLDTYDQAHAVEAASSAANIAGTINASLVCGSSNNQQSDVCKQTSSNCTCWSYTGTGTYASKVGYVHVSMTKMCYCPDPSFGDSKWH